jgi:hypothetical protein
MISLTFGVLTKNVKHAEIENKAVTRGSYKMEEASQRI